jgi:hypothetical protein
MFCGSVGQLMLAGCFLSEFAHFRGSCIFAHHLLWKLSLVMVNAVNMHVALERCGLNQMSATYVMTDQDFDSTEELLMASKESIETMIKNNAIKSSPPGHLFNCLHQVVESIQELGKGASYVRFVCPFTAAFLVE